ncbi:MAG: 1-acyl-sn-glycerol-3-phosphate acyltransferase [Deltaproteobacteria bacterium]|nr:1-acyl-sn-glycerol-3-phosphate acyltransferase [Deltaproteobacteria bacterium]
MWKRFINLFFYIYRPILFTLIAVDTAALGLISAITCIFDHKGNIAYFIVGRFWSRLNLMLSGVSVKVEGLEKIDRNQSYIVMSNHQSHFDVWALIAFLPLQLRWVMKKELRKVPVFGYCCDRMGHIYVDRGDSEKARESLQVAGEKMRAGASLFFFPEGTRSPRKEMLPFKKGGFVIALATGMPILPISVKGGREILPKNSIKIMPGEMIICIHDPLFVDEYSYDTRDKLMSRVRRIIEDGLA